MDEATGAGRRQYPATDIAAPKAHDGFSPSCVGMPPPTTTQQRCHGLYGQVVGAVRDAAHGRALAEAGVTRIFNPFDDAADHAAARLAHEIREQESPP